jgi:hypothetical protein
MVTAAFAQATNYTSVEAIAGKPVQLTYHASAKKDCTPAPPPTIRVTQAPKAAVLTIRPASTGKVAGCPKMRVPAHVVFYQAHEGYAGPDHAGYQATNSDGEVGDFDVSITVKAAPAPTPPAGGVHNLLLIGCLALAVASCAKTASLYPVNQVSATEGVLQARYMAYGAGHGQMEITMPSGELLKGEYSIVRGGTMNFGNIYASVVGTGGIATGTATSTNYAVPGGSPGTASLFGDRGTSMQCEFYNDNVSGHGYGGCRSSTGGLYRLQY